MISYIEIIVAEFSKNILFWLEIERLTFENN